jgi:hypothetical protein
MAGLYKGKGYEDIIYNRPGQSLKNKNCQVRIRVGENSL